MSQAEYSEEAIEAATRYLIYHDPDNASREDAIRLLRDIQSGYHSTGQDNPDELLELQKALEKDKESDS